jgi:hypothetical protein
MICFARQCSSPILARLAAISEAAGEAGLTAFFFALIYINAKSQ